MVENKETNFKRDRRLNRILLNPEAVARIENWIGDVQKSFKGVKVKRSDLVNYVIVSRSKELSHEEIQQLGRLLFDEVRFVNWALRALKEAKAKGEVTSLQELMKQFGVTSN